MFNFFRQLCKNGVKMTVGQYHNNSQLLHVEFERNDIKMNCVVDFSMIENYTGDFNERLIGILTQYLFNFLIQSKRAPEPYMNPPEFDVENVCKRLEERMVKEGLIPKEITDPEFMDKALNDQITKEYVENLEKRFNDAGILPMKLK